jgi:Flp pilus assembly protein TadG
MRLRSNKRQRKHICLHAQALVEFALILPLLLVLIIGAMDLGRVFYIKIVLTNAAREGANYLSRNPADGAAGYTNTLNAISTEGNSSGVTITSDEVDWTGTNCCAVGSPVVITIEKVVDLIFDGFLNTMGIIDGPITISSSVTMVVLP